MTVPAALSSYVEPHLLSSARVALPAVRIGSIDAFVRARVHEATGPAALSLALCLGASVNSTVFFAGHGRSVSPLRAGGVAHFFDPARLVRLDTGSRDETLWAGEEALRCKGAGLVTLFMNTGPDLFESRRLQIAAQAGGGIGLIIIGRRAQSSAAQTRWHCTHDSSTPGAWLWDLTKNKSGRQGLWSVRWTSQETGSNAQPEPTDLIRRHKAINVDASPPAAFARGRAETVPVRIPAAATARPLAPA